MSGTFRLVALPWERFAPMFSQTDAELEQQGAKKIVVHESPGFPCRVSLADASVGETVLALPFVHHDVASAYRSAGPIFVRANAKTATPAAGEIPVMFRHRLLSLRAYNGDAVMVNADVVQGTELEAAITRLFSDPAVGYLHIHNAKPGCFNCAVERA